MSKDKKAILDCLESERVAKTVTTDPGLASVHVLPMGRLIIAVGNVLWDVFPCILHLKYFPLSDRI